MAMYLGSQKVCPVVKADFIGIPKIVTSGGLYSNPTENFTFTLPSNVKGLNTSAMSYAFYGCTTLIDIDFSNLEQIVGYRPLFSAFYSTGLTNVIFPKLWKITGQQCFRSAFGSCSSLQSISFPVLSDLGTRTDQFMNMLSGVTGCTVHFPATMESTMSSRADVTGGFGGTNTTVLFDL